MGDNVCNLHICDNLDGLNRVVKDDAIKSLKTPDRLPDLARKVLNKLISSQNDQEMAYIIGKRYIYIMDRLYKLTNDKNFYKIRYGNEYKKVKALVDDLQNKLINRYEELAREKVNEHVIIRDAPEPVDEDVYLKPTGPPHAAGDDTNFGTSKAVFDNQLYITPVQLYNALMQEANILVVDIRQAEFFDESSINAGEGHMINIPEDILTSGLSANILGQRLRDETQAIWDRRDSFDVIVLMDWDTDDFNYSGSKLERLRISIVEWDLNRIYKQDPVVLSGGFKEFLEWYPSEITNSHVFLSQTNSEIDELLTLDDISYPETGSTGNMNLKVHTVNSVGDVQARITRDFDNNSLLGPPARASRSEGQLPKDFFASRELGISPYRSISQESIPRDYYADITPEFPDIPEQDYTVSEVPEKEIRNTIEVDKNQILNQARALKPKQDPRRTIIKNLIEENQDLFKPPIIDRSFKPFTPISAVPGEGYTGIKNLKNNCYVSCMLQCLKSLPLIKTMFISSNNYQKHIHKQPPMITLQFAVAMKALWEGTSTKHRTQYPQQFFEKIYELNPVYSRGNHEDTFEFFIFVFNLLSEDCSIELSRPKIMTEREKSWYSHLQGRSSYFIDMFYYQLKNTKTCWRCQKPNLVFDSDSTLMLPVPEKESVSLESLLKEYLKENLVSDYSCSNCKSTATIVNTKEIVLDPEILVIVLKRYIFNNDGTFKKNEIKIDFPSADLKFGNSSYKLYAIPQHTGSMVLGHYYASVLLNEDSDTWVLFNDEKITTYSCPVTEVSGIKSSCVGFFYVRQTDVKSECDNK